MPSLVQYFLEKPPDKPTFQAVHITWPSRANPCAYGLYNWVLERSPYYQYKQCNKAQLTFLTGRRQLCINSRNRDRLFLLFLQILWPCLPGSPVNPGGLDQAFTEAPSAHQRAPLRDRDGRGFWSSSQNTNKHVSGAPSSCVEFYQFRTSSCLNLHSVSMYNQNIVLD